MQRNAESGQSPKDDRLSTILSTAARIFAEKGYHNASIRDIAAATGISLAGLYHYLSSKQELLYMIQSTTMDDLLAMLEERLDDVEDPGRRVEVLVESHIGFFLRHPAEMKVLSHDAEALEGERLQEIKAKKQRLTRLVSEMLRELRPGLAASNQAEIATLTLFGMLNWTYTWYDEDQETTPEQLAGQMSSIFLHGFAGDRELTGTAAMN